MKTTKHTETQSSVKAQWVRFSFFTIVLTLIGGFVVTSLAQGTEGNLQWAKKAGGATDDIGNGIAVDSSGNSYVTGSFGDTATFGAGEVNQTTLESAGGADIFVAKYDSRGVLVWAKRAGGSGNDFGNGVAVDGSGNSFVTGEFSGTATFGLGEPNETSLTATGNRSIFVAKYNPSGALVWVKWAGGDFSANGYGIAVDSSGNSYVTGSFFTISGAIFGSGEPNETILSGGGAFVAKYDTGGALVWVKQASGGTPFYAVGRSIAMDGLGNSYVTGAFYLTTTFGAGEPNETILTVYVPPFGTPHSDIFVAKYDTNGMLQWAKQAGGNYNSDDSGYGVAVDGLGNSYVTGTFPAWARFGAGEANDTTLTGGGLFVAKYDLNGILLWAKQAGGGGRGIAVDGLGNSYVTGSFSGTATFGAGEANETGLTSEGSSDIFVAKYDSSGALIWAKCAGGTSADSGSDIAVDGSENTYVTGSFEGTATFGPGEAKETILTSAGTDDDIFVAKFSRRSKAPADFDGDGKTDITVYQTTTGNWFWVGSTSGFDYHLGFGGPDFLPVQADYDADGLVDTAVYYTTNGNWFIDETTAGFTIHPSFGGPGYIPVPGEYDGDGKTDIAVYQTNTGDWYFLLSSSSWTTLTSYLDFGGTEYIPVIGDYDGDGKTDLAIYQKSTGHWFYRQSTTGLEEVLGASFGGPNYIPVPGDYDGDGKTDIAVYEQSSGNWFYVGSTSGFGYHLAFGGANFTPVPGDYDDDGKTDTAVYDTTNGNWFIDQSTAGFTIHPSFGGPGYVPVLPQVTILRAMGLL